MAEDKIRVGIIGANAHYGWSMRAHLPALRAMPDYELTAVCTSRPETAAESAASASVLHTRRVSIRPWPPPTCSSKFITICGILYLQ